MVDNWKSRPVDNDFLLDSGLLFEINRSILHLVGLAFVITKDEQGKTVLKLKDGRAEPEKLIFDNAIRDKGTGKLLKFMRDFGDAQINRRRKMLGWSCQWVPSATEVRKHD
jgi:hypothetical protein